jgi:uncharacterized damage-inducible protein DinB
MGDVFVTIPKPLAAIYCDCTGISLNEGAELMNRVVGILIIALCTALGAFGQGAVTADAKAMHDLTKGNILKAADKMPEEHYSFKPTADVRSFGQLIGHVADAQYGICGRAGTMKRPEGSIEKTKTSKADLVAALKDAIAACDAVYTALTDAQAIEKVKFFGGAERTKLSVLFFNTTHNYEHYGNIVTYMRIKGLVPPSSEK